MIGIYLTKQGSGWFWHLPLIYGMQYTTFHYRLSLLFYKSFLQNCDSLSTPISSLNKYWRIVVFGADPTLFQTGSQQEGNGRHYFGKSQSILERHIYKCTPYTYNAHVCWKFWTYNEVSSWYTIWSRKIRYVGPYKEWFLMPSRCHIYWVVEVYKIKLGQKAKCKSKFC